MLRMMITFYVIVALAIITGPQYALAADPGFVPGISTCFPALPPLVTPTPWYTGPNVCKEERVLPHFKEWAEFQEHPTFGNSSSHSCNEENNNLYVCTTRVTKDGVTVYHGIKYRCCPGYVRPSNGISCVEQ